MDSEAAVTASEAYLARLCERVFLNLWSYPNLYRNQKNAGKGDGKELCDLLVVFGRDILLFSDKNCALRTDRDVAISWRRWHRDAVLDSAKQVAGAERWLSQYPDRVFTDRRCTQRLPIDLPSDPVFHRIVTCRGAASASRSAWGGTGSLFLTNRDLNSCSDEPFHLGCFDERRRMVHVFDEISLDAVLATLDTVSDFVEYLRKKEAFFRKYDSVSLASEESLIGLYMQGTAPSGYGHDFILPGGYADNHPTSVMFGEDFWTWWQNSEQRRAKAEADRISYAWDRLIETFSHHMTHGTHHFQTEGGVRRHEPLLRWMAREDRFRRRMLTRNLLDAMETTKAGQLRRRLLLSQREGDPAWLFLVLPRPGEMDYELYRERRRNILEAHCWVVKYLHPQTLDIAALAVEPKGPEMSEDAMYMDLREWNDEMNDSARDFHEKGGIFKSPTTLPFHDWEFPIRPETPASRFRRQPSSDQRRKRKRQSAKEARRKNR